MIYYSINVIYSWVLVGAFLLAVNIIISIQFNAAGGDTSMIGDFFFLFYLIILIVILVLSLSVKASGIEELFKAIACILAVYQFYVIIVVV